MSISTRKNTKNIKWVYPLVISASRATDIPACYASWFMERLAAGFCEWQNPFNSAQMQLVSFEKTKAIVFWSKNPAPLMRHLSQISDNGKRFYFQFTLNDYEKLEPGISGKEERIATFRKLAQNYPVIWRYDPVIFGNAMTVKWHMKKIESIIRQVGDVANKLVFSFLDLYPRVRKNLKQVAIEARVPVCAQIAEFSETLAELRDRLAPSLPLAVCAEAGFEFAKFGIEKNSCIDANLINNICHEKIFQEQQVQGNLFSRPAAKLTGANRFAEDKGQRPECHCAPSKDIGSYSKHACRHGCLYCYAGHFGRN